jgi:predicted lipoprotein with Yx(FWY)xxD motif
MRRRRSWWVVPAALLVVAGTVAVTATAAKSKPTVKMVKTAGLGKLLATSSGLTLYRYTDEKRGKIDCTGACARAWPPLLVAAGKKPVAGPGISAKKLGTVKRPDGKLQVTYNGFALYRYAPDKKTGDVTGQGVGKAWYAVAPSGALIRRAPAATEPPASSSPPTTTTPTDTTEPPPGGGYDYG